MGTRRGNREGSPRWEPPSDRRKYGRWKWSMLVTGVGRITVAGRKGESKTSVRDRLYAKRDEFAEVRRPTKGSLAEWCEMWLRLHVRDKAPRTQAYYREMLGHLLPHLGARPVGAITPEELLVALDRIPRPATRRKAYEVLRIALNRAVRTGRIRANVCATIDPPAVTPKRVEPPTTDDVTKILAAVRGQRDEALIVLALATGFRQGELVGLRWGDLDGASIHANGQLNRERQYVGAKRGSERVASLPSVALAALGAHRQRVTFALGRQPEPEEFIFADAHGRPMTGYEAYRRWQAALKAAGVSARPMHSARHFVNTALLEAGMPGELVRAVIGHRDARMTERYSHSTEGALKQAAAIMERALGNG